MDFVEYWESPRIKGFFSGSAVFSGTEIAVGKGETGRGLWPDNAPKVALVGVVASSRRVAGWTWGAVVGLGVVGVVSSPFRLYGSGARPVFTAWKDMV